MTREKGPLAFGIGRLSDNIEDRRNIRSSAYKDRHLAKRDAIERELRTEPVTDIFNTVDMMKWVERFEAPGIKMPGNVSEEEREELLPSFLPELVDPIPSLSGFLDFDDDADSESDQ